MKQRAMTTSLFTGLALLGLCGAVSAQALPDPPPRRMPANLPMQTTLYDAWLDRDLPLDELRRRAGRDFITFSDAREIHVEIVGPEGAPAIPGALVERHGGRPDSRWGRRQDAWVPLARLVEFARALPPGHRIVRAHAGDSDDVDGEGPAAIGSDTYRDGGANGAGLKIGVIDGSYAMLTAAVLNGDAPGGATLIDFTGGEFEAGEKTHGTECVETIFDHAPGAEYFIYKVDSLADWGSAVEHAIDNGIDIISLSKSKQNQGWWDNQGDACAVALAAANEDILFFTSAGNRAEQHWQGTFLPGMFNAQWHDWTLGDEGLDITVEEGGKVDFYLSWNTDNPQVDNYDFLLFDSTGTTVIKSSQNNGESYEEMTYENTQSGPVIVKLAVWLEEGPGAEFEVFGRKDGEWEYFHPSGSTSSPTNTVHPKVISVGAVHHDDYSAGNGASGVIRDSSSRGPTNSGMTVPRIVSTTRTSTFAGGTFGGTSCATPNAAGAACAFWSSVPQYRESPIQWLLMQQALAFKDWGAPGIDNVYGAGGINLVPYVPNTVWLSRDYGNVFNLPFAPFYSLTPFVQSQVGGGRLLEFPGGSYSETVVLDQPLVLDSAAAPGVFGD